MPKHRNILKVIQAAQPVTPTTHPDPNRLIRLSEILKILPIARATWWLWVAQGKAPSPIRLGRCTCWRYVEVVAMTHTNIHRTHKAQAFDFSRCICPSCLLHLPGISLLQLKIFQLFSTREKHMSTKILWQICHKKDLNNGDVTRYIIRLLQEQEITTKQVARDLNIPVERARNWYYKDTGMTAADLVKIMREYEFVRPHLFKELTA